MEKETKKLTPLYILKILREYSDDKHHITQTEILKKLEKYGIVCERKTISRSIDYLKEFGYNIERIIGGGCYFVNETFDDSELTFIVDCLLSSPAISNKHAQSLVERLTSGISTYEKQKFKNIFKTNEIIRTDNKQVFYNIGQINYAIENNKQISFIYNTYGKDKQLKPRREKRYVMSPYFMINSKGKYFLVCNKEGHDNLANYRIDYMTCVDVLDTVRKPINKTIGNEKGVNPVKYANEHIYMLAGETVNAKLKLSCEKVIGDVIDWFGKDIKITEKDDELYAEITANEDALIYWALQYGENVEIVAPQTTRDKVKNSLKEMIKKYNLTE